MRRITAGCIVLMGLSTSCTGGAEQSDAMATDSVATTLTSDSTQAEQAEVVNPRDDPFVVYGIPVADDEPADLAARFVWLVNESAEPMIVRASGGAESVVVDTVRAADSVLVKLATRAPAVEITARTPHGVQLGNVTLAMDPDTARAAFPH